MKFGIQLVHVHCIFSSSFGFLSRCWSKWPKSNLEPSHLAAEVRNSGVFVLCAFEISWKQKKNKDNRNVSSSSNCKNVFLFIFLVCLCLILSMRKECEKLMYSTKEIQTSFFFLLLICNCPNSSMFFQIKLLFVRFCFLPKENMQKKEKKRRFLLLVTLAFFLLFFLPTVRQTRKAGWSWKKTQN